MTEPQLNWELYKRRGRWRWRVRARNGRIVGASSQGYRRRSDAVTNATLFGYQP